MKLRDHPLMPQISEILREYCGKPIQEIGDIELSFAL